MRLPEEIEEAHVGIEDLVFLSSEYAARDLNLVVQ